MSTLHPSDRENKPRFWWLVILLVAGLVYFMGIAHESLWFDEAFSFMMASHSPGGCILEAGDAAGRAGRHV